MSTIGLELEWSDIDRRFPVPPHLGVFNTEDYSIVNSDGHANCPTGTTWQWGGEINTAPTTTPGEQAEIVAQLASLYEPVINWKSNLHVHVMPDVDLTLDENVELLKIVATRMRQAEAVVYSMLEPIPHPSDEEYPDPDHLAGAMKRYRRRKVSHQHSVFESRWEEMMEAQTFEQFYDAHASLSASGRRVWHIVPRAGMNLRSLRKHGTIEYRHFPGTADPTEILDCATWCQEFTRRMIEGLNFAGNPDNGTNIARELWLSRTWRIPKFQPYVHWQWLEFEKTKWQK